MIGLDVITEVAIDSVASVLVRSKVIAFIAVEAGFVADTDRSPNKLLVCWLKITDDDAVVVVVGVIEAGGGASLELDAADNCDAVLGCMLKIGVVWTAIDFDGKIVMADDGNVGNENSIVLVRLKIKDDVAGAAVTVSVAADDVISLEDGE